MKLATWFTVIGGVLLLFGLLTALISNHYSSRVMGPAALGVAVLAPERDSPEWQKKERLRARADCWFWVGIAATSVGVVLQTWAALLPRNWVD